MCENNGIQLSYISFESAPHQLSAHTKSNDASDQSAYSSSFLIPPWAERLVLRHWAHRRPAVHAYSKEPYPKDLTQTKQALLQKLSLEGKYKERKTTFTVLHHASKQL